MAKLVFGSGKDRVELSNDMAASFRSLMGKLAPTVVEVMEQRIDLALINVRINWPISPRRRVPSKPTHSVDLLEARLVVAPDSISSELASGAGYTRWIKTHQHGLNGKNPWIELVRKPAPTEAVKLGGTIGKQIIELAGDQFK